MGGGGDTTVCVSFVAPNVTVLGGGRALVDFNHALRGDWDTPFSQSRWILLLFSCRLLSYASHLAPLVLFFPLG